MDILKQAAQAVLDAHEHHDPLGVVMADLRAALAQPEQTAMPQDIAKMLFDNVESLYVEDAQPEQEPVAWLYEYTNPRREKAVGFYPSQVNGVICTPLYTTPPQRKPLTEEEVYALVDATIEHGRCALARAIEKAHGIGGEK
jgi:hypothetical protein